MPIRPIRLVRLVRQVRRRQHDVPPGQYGSRHEKRRVSFAHAIVDAANAPHQPALAHRKGQRLKAPALVPDFCCDPEFLSLPCPQASDCLLSTAGGQVE